MLFDSEISQKPWKQRLIAKINHLSNTGMDSITSLLKLYYGTSPDRTT
jgi:hypothetical protein